MTTPLLVSTTEAQRMLSCGKSKLFELLSNGDIEGVKIGSRRLVTFESLSRFVDRLKTEAA